MGPRSGHCGHHTEHTVVLTPWSLSQRGGGSQIIQDGQLQNNATHAKNTAGVLDSFKLEFETSLEFAFGVGLFVLTAWNHPFQDAGNWGNRASVICQDHSRPRTPEPKFSTTEPHCPCPGEYSMDTAGASQCGRMPDAGRGHALLMTWNSSRSWKKRGASSC